MRAAAEEERVVGEETDDEEEDDEEEATWAEVEKGAGLILVSDDFLIADARTPGADAGSGNGACACACDDFALSF